MGIRGVCAEPGCPEPPTKRGRCDRHPKAKDRDRRRARGIGPRSYSSAPSFYASKRWALVRRKKLSRDPLCEKCGALAQEVHHRTPLAAGGDPYALDGLEALCKPCHSRETRQETLGRGR